MNQYIILHTVIKTFLCHAPYLRLKTCLVTCAVKQLVSIQHPINPLWVDLLIYIYSVMLNNVSFFFSLVNTLNLSHTRNMDLLTLSRLFN